MEHYERIGNALAKNENFCYGAEKGPYGHSPLINLGFRIYLNDSHPYSSPYLFLQQVHF